MNFLGDRTLILSLGKGSGTGAGAYPPGPSPLSDISSESLLLLELSGSPACTASVGLLENPFGGDSGNSPGVTLATFASSVAHSARSR